LRLLIEVMGEERVMLGSDSPFPLGELSVGKLIRESGLSGDAQARLLGGNAARFFGLDARAN
jgi:aminocarboxymuconate-semialdehyde decarboxylase